MKMIKRSSCAVSAVILLFMIGWIIWGNTALELNTYTVASERIPAAFDGFRIVQISDFHNAAIGKDNEKLLALLQRSQPDVIAITGDFVDSRNTNMEIALHLAEEAMKIAPCFYVAGNHEARIPEYPEFKQELFALGVAVLEDERMEYHINEDSISIIGVNDPLFDADNLSGSAADMVQDKLQQMVKEDSYTVLLSHRPELFDVYVENHMDLVFSGHAHGGQFRIPFVGGLFAPNQGFFPTYDAGMFTENGTNMIVSRGIGNSIFPFRINDRPELILIELIHIPE